MLPYTTRFLYQQHNQGLQEYVVDFSCLMHKVMHFEAEASPLRVEAASVVPPKGYRETQKSVSPYLSLTLSILK